jgi:hypothetical protein
VEHATRRPCDADAAVVEAERGEEKRVGRGEPWRRRGGDGVGGDEPAERGEEKANDRIHDAIRDLLETSLRMRMSLRGPRRGNDGFCTSGRGLSWRWS